MATMFFLGFPPGSPCQYIYISKFANRKLPLNDQCVVLSFGLFAIQPSVAPEQAKRAAPVSWQCVSVL